MRSSITNYVVVKYLSISLALVLSLVRCSPASDELQSHGGEIMGTHYSVQWHMKRADQAQRIAGQVDRLLEQINRSMSTYISDSEISRFNNAPVDTSFEVSEDFSQVMQTALGIADLTRGAFDFTIGALVNAWGFGPDGVVSSPPDEKHIRALKAETGFEYISMSEEGRRLIRRRDSYIDLSAVAKGYAVDVIAHLLETKGIENFLVEIGGEIRAGGVKPGGRPWRIGIEMPDSEKHGIQKVIDISNISVATSGDYRNYFEENGVRYSHTIDPATGRPIRHRLASVTVLKADCASADALATALLVMGPEKGLEFAQQQDIAAYFIVKSRDGFETRWTEGFATYLLKPD
ncbi:MAG: FAD:protein FMN transferase [Proteobacteria bacterium]|nr:FAD:protein FMN transferase [Pseudomonadota bacterium]